jgi:hypothetical protein
MKLRKGGLRASVRTACTWTGETASLHVPAESVTSERAARYVALSGEVLAETQPDPGAWSRVLEHVKQFEQSAGIAPPR